MNKLPLFKSLVVELTSECNRSCRWCMRHGDTRGRRFDVEGEPVRKQMPTHHAERILRHAREMKFRGQVTFYLMSEPFLDDRLIEMASLARSLGMGPYVNTNGDLLLRDPVLAREAGKVFEWVEVTVYERKAEAARSIRDRLRQSVGARVRFKPLSAMGPRPHVPMPGTALPDVICSRPAEKFIVQYDGSMPMCCYDLNTQFELPNAFDLPVREAWNHPERLRVANELLVPGGRRKFELCATCPMPAAGYPPPFEVV